MTAEATTIDRSETVLVDRLWRSGTSATAVSPSTRDDHSLVHRLAFDDRSALVPLLRRHQIATWRLAAVVTMDLDSAIEATVATWDEVTTDRSPGVPHRSSPRAWLLEIARRHALAVRPIGASRPSLAADASIVPFDPTGDAARMAAALCRLDEPLRTAVWVHTVEGLDVADAALVLDRGWLETHDLTDDAMARFRTHAVEDQLTAAEGRCRTTVSGFLAYLTHDLPIEDEKHLVDHVGRCRPCAARLDALEAPGLTLVDRVVHPPSALTEQLRAGAIVAAGV